MFGGTVEVPILLAEIEDCASGRHNHLNRFASERGFKLIELHTDRRAGQRNALHCTVVPGHIRECVDDDVTVWEPAFHHHRLWVDEVNGRDCAAHCDEDESDCYCQILHSQFLLVFRLRVAYLD